MYIKKGKQINQKYTSNICKYILTFVLVNTDQTLNWISRISRSGSLELLSLMQSFSLKEVILYSQSEKAKKCFTNY